MNEYEKHLELIKTGLLSLKATGEDGFEGLLRIVLTKLTGIPFRLAASGLQGGKDGDAAMPSDPVCFEAKRYSGNIHRNEVLTKIADLARQNGAADFLWVLGATTEVNSQLARALHEDGDRNAISTLILDWTAAPLPLLAIAVVAADIAAIDFIVGNYHEKTEQKKLSAGDLAAAFAAISSHQEFESILQRLKSNLNVSKLSFKRAVDLNAKWREETFSSARYARERLGQGLAVLQDKTFQQMRTELRKRISVGLETGKEVILLGDEGHGKSWLSAQLCSDEAGLALFISAEQLDGVSVHDLDDFLVDLLIKQTGEKADDTLKLRWEHRLKAWKTTPPVASLLVVVDGLNQRQNLRWDRLLNGIQSRLTEIRGRMVVTVRPYYWQKTIVQGLAFKPKTFEVPEWSPAERDELLTHYGIALEWLDQQTLKTLQNPRLLSVAVETLPHRDAIAWKGLTTDRLLMEHLRASQLENYEDENFVDLTKRLSEHATQVLERVKASPDEPPQNFRADSTAVIETRFFRPLPGPGDLYELRDEGLTLALGFTLVDQLWQTHSAKRDLDRRITQLIEPINAMDRTADVLFASLMICALDDIRFDPAIFSVLQDAFANIQNVSDHRFEEFVEIVKHKPDLLFNVLEDLCLERGRRINQDWFIHAAFMVASTEVGWNTAQTAIHRWLRYYNKDPVTQTNRYHKQSEADYEKRLDNKKAEIHEAITNLSAFEKQLLEQMTEVSSEPDELYSLALRLLAGRSLAPFADSFVAMSLAFVLNRNVHLARKEFQQLTTFNYIDHKATRNAFLKAIEPLRREDSSKSGQWTIVRMLYATGFEEDAVEGNLLAEDLQKDRPFFEPPSANDWQQVKVANPDANRPVNMDNALKQFKVLDPDTLLQTMMVGAGDRFFRDFLPVACRFEPTAAIQKTSDILTGLLTRTGFPLRQVILNFENHLPLVDQKLAKKLIERLENDDVFNTLPERDQWICRMVAFGYVAAEISASEQLRCLTGKMFGPYHLLSVIPSLKPQPTEEITVALRDALQKKNEDAAYAALTAALYGHTLIDEQLEKLILQCPRCASSKLRAIAYELAVQEELESIRHAHIHSNWTAVSADKDTYEFWFGSMLLVEACARGEITVDSTLARIDKKTWFAAAERLGATITKPLVDSFLRTLKSGISAVQNLQPPAADFILSRTEPAPFPYLSIEETDRHGDRFPKQKSSEEVLQSDDDFDEKQNKLHTVADKFFQKLKRTDAQLLVQEITINNLQCIVSEVPTFLNKLVEILDRADSTQFVWLKNLAFSVANLISSEAPDKAVELLTRASETQGFITQALGDDLTLEHQAIWGSAISAPVSAFWQQRIFSSENDVVLAKEVLAAERFGAADFIQSMIRELASSEDSLDRAYAITMAGYSIQSNEFIDIISEHMGDKCVSGQAAQHAKPEHENAIWAKHWVESMWQTPSLEEFWRCLVIAKTCMDGRANFHTPSDTKWTHYAPIFQKVRKTAIKERNKKREKRLIGQEKPAPIFVVRHQY